jgi:hypothetical protein
MKATYIEEHRQRVRESHADVSGELNPFYGKHHSNENKLQHGIFMKQYYREHEHHLLNIPRTGEVKQRLREVMLSQPTITCPHCNKIGKRLSMYRWHFDNCKLKK